ncbi:MAG TPA: SAF domain-containing protein, partial [Chloroflexota bacterium]|nr:SAF domain-containing protein [Chloroflexota bacterium]
MQRKRLGYIMIGGGLALALIVGLMVFDTVNKAESVKASLPTARVVIATADIPARSEIAASMVNVRTVPDELVQAGAATKIEDVVGKFSPDAISKGAVINSQKIGPVAVKNAPSFRIEKGKVMYVMPVSFAGSQFSIAQVNALRAGDRVDLLYTTINAPSGMSADQRDEVRANPIPYLQTRIMLQDLRIQEIGSYASDGSLVPATGDPNAKGAAATSISGANIIFIVKPEESLVLKWLKDAATYYKDSNIEMVLRSPADDEQADNNLVVNFNYMRDKYNLAPPPSLPTAST